MIKYAQEEFTTEFIDEVSSLISMHWEEVQYESIEFDPDWDKYLALEEAGVLRLYTARIDGELKGYYTTVVDTFIHAKDVVLSYQDSIYVEPETRIIGGGAGLIDYAEKQMKKDCIDIIFMAVKEKRDFSRTLVDRGYILHEKIYIKNLGDT